MTPTRRMTTTVKEAEGAPDFALTDRHGTQVSRLSLSPDLRVWLHRA